MLQQIATAKSDVATFAIDPLPAGLDKLKPADDFAEMLKHQQGGSRRQDELNQSGRQGDPGIKSESSGPRDREPEIGQSPSKSAEQAPPKAKERQEQQLNAKDQLPPISAKGEEIDKEPAGEPMIVSTSALDEVQSDIPGEQITAQDELPGIADEASHWLDMISKLVSETATDNTEKKPSSGQILTPDAELQVQQLIGEQLSLSPETANLDESGLLAQLAELLDNLLQKSSAQPQDAAQLQKNIHTELLDDPQLRAAFAQLLALYNPSNEAANQSQWQDVIDPDNTEAGELALSKQLTIDSLPLGEQKLLLELMADAIAALNTSHTEPVPTANKPDQLVPTLPTLEIAEPQLNTEPLGPEVLALLPETSSLSQLIQLPKDKLDKALIYLEQKLLSGEMAAGVTNADAKADKALSLAMDNVLANKAEGGADFIGALKSGIAEVKVQLNQGREPGIDLKGLVNEALKASSETVNVAITKQPEQLDLALKALNQTLDFAQQLGSSLEQMSQQNATASSYRELGQLQGEQVKSSQLHTHQLDKALNLAKPEAHQQLAEKVRWMVNQNQLVADIRLDPAELGSMQVKVSLAGESANVSFVVNSAQAKEAVDNATPKLREMLAEKGIELGQSSVEQEEQDTPGQEEQMAGNGHQAQPEEHEAELGAEQVLQQPVVNGALGGIDYFV